MIKTEWITANQLMEKELGEIIKDMGIKDEDILNIHTDTDGCSAIEYLIIYKEKE